MAGIEQRLTERILTTLGMPDTDYLAAECGGRLTAISGVAKAHWTGQNLLTGVCVLPSHQRQGLGASSHNLTHNSSPMMTQNVMRKTQCLCGFSKAHSESGYVTNSYIGYVTMRLGKYLLGLSLGRLRAMGLRQARVYTENGSLADRKVYPLFGSVREEDVEYPGVQPSNNSFNRSDR